MSRALTADLNSQQRQAVTEVKRPLLITAGPGSGKTKTIVHRLAYILDSGLATDNQLFVATFTNRAATELRQRLAGILNQPSATNPRLLPFVGTFHGNAARILRQEGPSLGLPPGFCHFMTSSTA